MVSQKVMSEEGGGAAIWFKDGMGVERNPNFNLCDNVL